MNEPLPEDEQDDDGTTESCPDCGRELDTEMRGFDDVSSAPFVCSAGDLHCIPCGRKCERGMERQQEEDADVFEEFGGPPL